MGVMVCHSSGLMTGHSLDFGIGQVLYTADSIKEMTPAMELDIPLGALLLGNAYTLKGFVEPDKDFVFRVMLLSIMKGEEEVVFTTLAYAM